MSNKILDIIDGKLILTPECLCISPFSEIWSKDKSKDKVQANNKIKYVWFFSDFNSPYYQHPESDRERMIISDVLKDKNFKVDKGLKEAIKKYKELNSSPAIEAVDAAYSFMRKIQQFFKDVDLSEVNNPKAITDIFSNMPKMVEALNQTKKAATEEQTSGTKVRGQATLGMFEDID